MPCCVFAAYIISRILYFWAKLPWVSNSSGYLQPSKASSWRLDANSFSIEE